MNEEFLALTTSLLFVHSPSLLPIEWFSKVLRLVLLSHASVRSTIEKKAKLDHLAEVKVVTRSPRVNLRKDHYRMLLDTC